MKKILYTSMGNVLVDCKSAVTRLNKHTQERRQDNLNDVSGIFDEEVVDESKGP